MQHMPAPAPHNTHSRRCTWLLITAPRATPAWVGILRCFHLSQQLFPMVKKRDRSGFHECFFTIIAQEKSQTTTRAVKRPLETPKTRMKSVLYVCWAAEGFEDMAPAPASLWQPTQLAAQAGGAERVRLFIIPARNYELKFV